jgi:tRNA-binding protein
MQCDSDVQCYGVKDINLMADALVPVKTTETDWETFMAVDMRVGTIVRAERFPQARRPAYILHIDFGTEIGVLKSSAQITDIYDIDTLQGRQVTAVVNFPEKQIGPMRSQCLVLGFYGPDGVVLAVPDQPLPNGVKLG